MKKTHIFLTFTIQFLIIVSSLTSLTGCATKEEKYAKLMEKAKQYVSEKKWEEARVSLLAATEQKETDEVYSELADVLMRQQKAAQAVENYKASININPKNRDPRLKLASIYIFAKEYELAEDQIRKIKELNPEDVDAMILEANIEAGSSRKDFKKAREIFTRVLAIRPNSVGAISGLGSLALLENKYTEAEDYLLKALKLDQENNPIRMILADLYAKQGRVEEAQSLAEGLIKDNPENVSLRFGLGEFLLKRGLTDEAEAQYLEILKEDPFKLEARDRLYDIYISHNEKEKAKKLGQEIADKNKDLPGSKYFLGRNAELDKNYPLALELFLKTISGLNTFAPAFRKAGLLEIAKGDTKTGVQHLNQAVALDPADIGARLTLGQIAITEQDYAKAKDHVSRILEKFPKQLGANVMRADIALLEGNTKEARSVYQFLIENFPTFPSGYFKMALLEEQEKNYTQAIANYRKTLSFDSNVILPAQRLAALLILKVGNQKAREEFEGYFKKSEKSKGEFKLVLATLTLSNVEDPKRLEKARALFNEAAELNPSLIGAYFAIGAIDAQSGNLDSAIENYKKVIQKNKSTLPPYILLALAYENKKDFKNAEEIYRKTLDVAPRFAPAANNLAYLLAEKIPNGNLDDALRFAQIAKESLSQDPGVADTLGWVNYKRGSIQVALANLQEAVSLDKKSAQNGKLNPEILYHLAIVYKDLKQIKEAKDAITQAIKFSADNTPLQHELLEFNKNLR